MRTMINILPATYRRQQMARNRAMQWVTIIVAVLGTGWCWHWIEMREQTQLTQQLDVLSREHAPTQTMLKQVVDMRRKLKELNEQETVAKELETQRNALTLLGVVSQTAAKSKGRLRITKLELNNFQNVGGVERSGAAPAPGGLLLTGVSLDNPAVAELLDGLQHSGIFSRVELRKLKEQDNKSSALRDYEVRCEF
jgi:type IV pilus assembly PilN-like protein